jgi:hypothetical protein
MPLTGRFRFRRSIMGRVFLQLEHETGALWPLSIAGRRRHAWRDARIVDLLAPQIHGLLELEHFVEEFPTANYGALATPLARRRLPPAGQPQAPALAGPNPGPANGAGSVPFRHAPFPGRGNGSATGTAEPAPV